MNDGTDGKPLDAQPAPGVAPPMSASMLARLFGVPLLIVTLIVGSAVVVVLLFGSISSESERSVSSLLSVMEREPAGKVLDMALMPADKEIWQAGKELAARLQKKEVELSVQDKAEIVARLSAVVLRDLPRSAMFRDDRRGVLHFAMAALAATGDPESIAPLRQGLHAQDWQTRQAALKSLGSAHRTPGARDCANEAATLLDDPEATVRTVAAYVMTFLASPDEEPLLVRMEAVCDRPGEDREVIWNATLSLARLGSPRCKRTLLPMLDRAYWNGVAVRLTDPGGSSSEKPMPPGQVESMLCAAIEAAACVPDERVHGAVSALDADESLRVRQAVRAAREKFGPVK